MSFYGIISICRIFRFSLHYFAYSLRDVIFKKWASRCDWLAVSMFRDSQACIESIHLWLTRCDESSAVIGPLRRGHRRFDNRKQSSIRGVTERLATRQVGFEKCSVCFSRFRLAESEFRARTIVGSAEWCVTCSSLR